MISGRTITHLALFACLFALGARETTAGPGEVPPTPRWLNDITRVAYTDLSNAQRTPEWPEKVIADFAAASVQMMFSRAHSGDQPPGLFWKSALGEPAEIMGDRDGTREVVALCRKHGLRYLAYYWAQREGPSLGETHPNWRALDAAGKPTTYYCHNTPYHDLVKRRVVELVKDVGVDGIFFDMFHATGSTCYCAACRAKFREQTGQDPPVKQEFGNPLWVRWVEFKYRSIEDALRDVNLAVKAANPEAVVVVNSWNAWVYGHSHNIRSSIRVAEVVDGLLEETGWYDTVDPSFFAFPARHNFMNWHLAGLCKGKRAFMWGAASVPGWMANAYQEPAIRVMTMMANGAVPAHSVPGRDVLPRLMADVRARESHFRGSRLHPWCGLVVSEKSELWYGREDPKGRYVKGVYGAFQAMLERHLTPTLVTDRELETGLREPYRVLFLPNCAAMSDAEAETVRRFVREGGGLVATYETSLYDETGQARTDFALADVLKARRVGAFDNQQMRAGWNPMAQHNAHLYFAPAHPWTGDASIAEALDVRSVIQPVEQKAAHVPLHCRMLLVEPTEGAPSPLRLTTASTNRETKEVDRTNHAAVIETTYGKGRVVYLPADVTWSYFRYGHAYLSRVIELALRQAASEPPPVEVAAPAIVQAMTHVQGDRLVVHLLNDISSFGRGQNVAGESLYVRREVIPIHDITVTFRDKGLRRFLLVPGEKPLEAEPVAEGLRVTVPRLDVHCMVVAER